MIPAKVMTTKVIFTGKPRLDSNGCLTVSLPKEESKRMTQDEYLITVEGPINEKRTSYNRVVISL